MKKQVLHFTSVNEIMCKNLLLEMKRDIENENGLAKDLNSVLSYLPLRMLPGITLH
jgi:hypothetical protein